MTPQETALVEELNCRLEVLEEQRNHALATHVIAAARLLMATKRIAELEAKLMEKEKCLVS